MKTTILILILLGICFSGFSQTYDTKYTAEYVLKDAKGTEINRLKLFRSGNKIKFQKVDNKGKTNETTTDIYVFKDEAKIYFITSSSAGKFGSKSALDIMYVGMQTGIYILDLGNLDYIFNSNTRSGSGTVLGMECVKYTIASDGSASSDYYMYQDNLMLRRSVGSAAEGNTIEALSYDNTSSVPDDIFIIPGDVQYF